MNRWLLLGLCLLGLSQSQWAAAQGVLLSHGDSAAFPRIGKVDSSAIGRPVPPSVPTPPASPVAPYAVREIGIQARIRDQVAQVQITQTFVNKGSQPIEAQFLFPLPPDAAIDGLTLLVDGTEHPGKLMAAKEARAIYESIVRSRRDPALLEWMGQGLFQTSVFPLPPGGERKVTLKFSQLLRKSQSVTDFIMPLSSGRYSASPVEKVDIRVAIESTGELKNVYSPSHTIELQRPTPKSAVVTYSRANEIPIADFRVMFDAQAGDVGATVLSYRPAGNEEGYFLLLASPKVQEADAPRPKKTVIFVVDRSGSMAGKKIEQAKAALKFVLNNLREGDLFNIVAYDTNVESFRPELERYNDTNRAAALGYVEGLYAGGGTNLQGALTSAFKQLKDPAQPSYVLFLTDGLPTAGITNEAQIANDAKSANQVRGRLLTFGVGYDVNSRLLDRLARDGFGLSEYVKPDEDIETHVAAMYRNVSAPVLTQVNLNVDVEGLTAEQGAAVSRVYPKGEFDLFEGQQLVLVGRYRKAGAAKVVIRGTVGGQARQYDFPATFVEQSHDQSLAFVEKLWAIRRVGEIIDQLDLVGKNDELVKELVELSTKHGILTPYTAFLADDTSRPIADAEAIHATQRRLSSLSAASGVEGVAQRSAKGGLQQAQNANELVKTAPSGVGGGQGGAAAGRGGANTPAAGFAYRDTRTNQDVLVDSVRQYGNKTVYARNRLAEQSKTPDAQPVVIVVTPETAALDLERDKAQIEVIDRFSEPYFALVQANSLADNELLAQQRDTEQLLVQFRGKNYLIR